MTYGVIRRYISVLTPWLFRRVILDEAQLIKNENSKLTQAVKRLQAAHRLALTGTPIENHFDDLFSIFDFINPGLLRRSDFQICEDEKMRLQLKKIRPLILRRRKKDVLKNLPEKREETLSLPLAPEQARIYSQIQSYYVEQLQGTNSEEEFNEHRLFFLEGLLRLRQVCCHPRILYKPDDMPGSLDSCKMQYFLPDLKKNLRASTSKILVFSQFVTFLKIIRRELEDENVPFAYLDGQVQDRQEIIDEFQTRSSVRVFRLGLRVGGLGLNLTAANLCYLMDPWWNPAVESQATDRMHRIGQTKEVRVVRLITRGTVEEKMMELQRLKSSYAEFVSDTEADFLKNLTREDFADLMRM
ncbi:MAG: hypothetical protein C5B49_02580 [Bdellovibrio sp.]|nr:MAG: hypothetical protein C5B49_02580 [Bdellovibrio sp.]